MTLELFQKHGEAAVGDLLEQFKGQPAIEALLRIVGKQVDELEAALFDLVVNRFLDGATGDLLRLWAKVANVVPGGDTDDELRARVKAVSRLLRSSGTTEDLLEVLALVLGASAPIGFTEYPPASFVITVPAAAAPLARIIADLIRRARAGGVGASLVFTGDDATAFLFASGDSPETSTTQGFSDDAQTFGGLLASVY